MKLYKISRWAELYENNRSRLLISLTWVLVPNRHDGENFSAIMAQKQAAEIFSAWILILQVASKCKPRGLLVKDNGTPHDSSSLSVKTRAPKAWFDAAFSFLEKQTDWLESTDVTDTCQIPATFLTGTYSPTCQEPAIEGKGREGKEGKGTIEVLPKEAEFWNNTCNGLSKVAAMSDERWKRLRARRQDSFWVANFEQAVIRVTKSDFCCGKIKSDRMWKADFDWMLQSNAVPKIMEGKYDNRTPPQNQRDRDTWPGDSRFSLASPPPTSTSPELRQAYDHWKQKRMKEKS